MTGKLGRNDPCWCGSGKKYKKCHLHRHSEERVPWWEVEKQFKKSFSKKYCSCPETLRNECSGSIIRAHTIPKSSSLKAISRDNHVYGLDLSFAHMVKNEGTLSPELIGVNRASTFTGFCATHDKRLFSPAEDEPFESTLEQIFLLGYRALAREYFTKRSQVDLNPTYKTLDRGRPHPEQEAIQAIGTYFSMGTNAGMRDVTHHKELYDQVLLSRDYEHGVRGYVISFDDVLPILCSGAIYPEFDFEGNRLQSLAKLDETLESLSFSMIVSGQKTYAVFSWLEDSDSVCQKLIESLDRIRDSRVFSALVRFSFKFYENVFISPDWWEGLCEEYRKTIVKWLATGADLQEPVFPNCLVDDNKDFGNYRILERERLGG